MHGEPAGGARGVGVGAGALTTAQQVGGALGVGIVGVVFYGAVDQGVTEASGTTWSV
ncbi:hypothetical protein [Streptomyces griseosporeus]|uniref:hypothetical protein n=1 Tax=Streptomyces griseosporeus TaxID=1910 RepID=UPI0036FA5C24